ncbi:unnamed protein product [Withania somnifera]
MEKKKYPIGPEHYTLYEEVGQGVSASVHRALCIPLNEVVAIKILDFERDNSDLNNISREAQTMVLVDHPNVLKSHCSFVSDHNLWVIMPYMAGGSCLHILKAAHPDGFEETVIATVLREVLKGLEYLHHHGFIHRDVKAGNILIDARGGIKLGDFGVSAYLFDSGDRQRMRNTFVGTPCWMAPEVMEQLHGYDFKADIWSFGITSMELAHGHAPFSKYPPMKSFKQMIASCLVKDPSKRPSAKKLLKHHFFKQARSNDYIARTLLEGFPALGDRMRALKRKEEDMLAQKKIPDGQKEEISQNEYKRGISSWNFNLDDLKAQASLIPDEEIIGDKDLGGTPNSMTGVDFPGKQLHKFQHQFSFSSQYSDAAEFDGNNPSAPPSPANQNVAYGINKCEKSDDDLSIASSFHDHQIPQNSSPCYDNRMEMNLVGKGEQVADAKLFESMPTNSRQSDKSQLQNVSSCNGAPVLQTGDDVPTEVVSKHCRTPASSGDFDEKTKGHVVQQRGRFKVTSENVDLEKVGVSPMLHKSQSMLVIPQTLAATLPVPPDATPPNLLTPSHFPTLQNILETNILQRESILRLMRQVALGDATVDAGCRPSISPAVEKSLLEVAHDKEKELISEIAELQWRLIRAQEELQKYKAENVQNSS